MSPNFQFLQLINLNLAKLLSSLAFGLFLTSTVTAQIIYVDDDSPGGNGSSWATAYQTLAQAANRLGYDNAISTVYVAEGTYSSDNVALGKDSKRFYGGFTANPANPTERYVFKNPSIVKNSVFQVGYNIDNTIIDGFSFENSKLYFFSAGLNSQIRNCMIYGKTSSNNGEAISIYDKGRVLIQNCVIFNNSAVNYGGAIGDGSSLNTLDGGYITIERCLFVNNSAGISGGAIGFQSAVGDIVYMYIINSLFLSNTAAQNGAALYFQNLELGRLTNCNLIDNSPGTSGTLFLNNTASNHRIINNIFTDSSEEAITVLGTTPNSIRNNLFHSNTGGDLRISGSIYTGASALSGLGFNNNVDGPAIYAEGFTGTWTTNSTLLANYSIISDATQNFEPKSLRGDVIKTGAGNAVFVVTGNTSDTITVYGDMAAASVTSGSTYTILDFELQDISAGIDDGDSSADNLPSIDFDGDPRINGLTVDIGMQETDLGPWILSVSRLDANPLSELSARFQVVFSEPVTGFDLDDIQISQTGVQNASVLSLAGSDDAYTITLFTGDSPGSLTVNILDDGSIIDATGNSLTGGPGVADGFFDQSEVYTMLAEPELDILYQSGNVISGVGNYSFATMADGETPATLTFEIQNIGRTILNTSSITAPSPFEVATAFASPLASNTTDTLILRLPTDIPGIYADNISIDTDDGDEDPFLIPVSGQVLYNRLTPQVVSISAAQDPIVNSSVALTVTFNESVTDLDASDFLLIKPNTIASATINSVSGSGDTYALNVTFGGGWGDVVVQLNDDDSILDLDLIPLGGTGTGNGDFSKTFEVDLPGNNVFVDIDAAPGGDGLNWATAYDTIQEGINAAYASGKDTVWVAEGTYYEHLDMANDVQVRGGFAGTESAASDRGAISDNRTILDGQAAYATLVDLASADRMALERLWLTAAGDSAIKAGTGTGFTKVIDCVIYANDAASGGGIYLGDGDFLIEGCKILGNGSSGSGGGIAAGSYGYGDITIRNSVISGNISGGSGGGLSLYGNNLTMVNCDVSGNSSNSSGGILVKIVGMTHINNCTFIGNTAVNYGGIFLSNGAGLEITNNIFVNNNKNAIYANFTLASGIMAHNLFEANPDGDLWASQSGSVFGAANINSIFAVAYGNTDGDLLEKQGAIGTWTSAPIAGLYNTLTDNLASFTPGALTGKLLRSDAVPAPLNQQLFMILDNTTTTVDLYGPIATFLFDEGTGYEIVDHSLQDGSPALNAGSTTVTTELASLDILGNSRVSIGRLDIGAYELQEFVEPSVISIRRGTVSTSTNLAVITFRVEFSESVSGVDISDFAVDETGGVSGSSVTDVIGSGRFYTVTVVSGSGNGTISIDLNDDDTISDSGGTKLGGTGIGNGEFTAGESYTFLDEPEIRVTRNGIELFDGIDSLSFGTAVRGETSPTITLNVQNIGANALTISNFTLPAGFNVIDPLSTTIFSGSSDTMILALDTQAVGLFTGDLVLQNDDSDEDPFTLGLLGQIIAPQTMPMVVNAGAFESDHVIFGRDDNDEFGNIHDMASGDFNGDGLLDFAFGASAADGIDNTDANAGEVCLFLGRSDMPGVFDVKNIWGSDMDMIVYGRRAGELISSSMIAMEDLNGDGLADLLIGTDSSQDLAGTVFNKGRVYIIFGRKENIPSTVELEFNEADTIIGGTSSTYGYMTDDNSFIFGDINHDGLTDIMLGGRSERAYAIFGRTSWPASINVGSGGANIIFSAASGGLMGMSKGIACADINGDSIQDFIISDYTHNSNKGAVYVVFGQDTAYPTSIDLPTQADVVILGDGGNFGSNFGIKTIDINGDGIDDLIIGAGNHVAPQSSLISAGEIYVLLGRSNWPMSIDLSAENPDSKIRGRTTNTTSMGSGGIHVGDFNGDGYGDFVTYAPFGRGPNNDRGSAGEAYVFLGSSSIPALREIDDGDYDLIIYAATAGDNLGRYGYPGISDVNGDGLDDILLTSLYSDGPGDAYLNGGEGYVLFGAKALPSSYDLLTKPGDVYIYGDTGDYLSYSFIGGADFNSDSYNDLIVGSRRGSGQDNSRTFAGEVHVVQGGGAYDSASYLHHTLPGDALRQTFGSTRVKIDYNSGSALSLTEVTLHRDNSGIAYSPVGTTYWQIESDRSNFEAVVSFKYIDAYTSGLAERNLSLIKADSLTGPFMPIAADIDVESNTIVTTTTSFSYFILTADNPIIGIYDGAQQLVDGVDSVDLGSVVYGDPGPTRIITVTNTGTGDLHTTTPTLPTGYSLIEPLDSVIAPASNDTFTIKLTGVAAGTYSGTVTIGSDDPDMQSFEFDATGLITAAEADLTLNAATIADGSGPVDFGTILLNIGNAEHTFRLENLGDATLNITDLTLPLGYQLTEGLDSSIAIGNFDTFTVQLDNSSTGTFTGSIEITCNDPDENPYDFSVAGTVEDHPVIYIYDNLTTIALTGDTVDLGQHEVGAGSISRTFAIENQGSAVLTISSIDLPSGYNLTDNVDGPIPSLSGDTFEVSISLANAGIDSGLVTITSDDPTRSPYTFTLTTEIVDTTNPIFAGLQTATAGRNTVSLSWGAAVDLSGPLTYEIFRAVASSGQNFGSPLTTVSSLNYQDSSVVPGNSYYYVVRARDAEGNTETNTVELSAHPWGNPDHFDFSAISSPQVSGVEFATTITVRDIANNLVQDHAAAVDLTAFDGGPGGTQLGLTPAITGSFTAGVWSGDLAVMDAGSDVEIFAAYLTAQSGSNSFTVVEPVIELVLGSVIPNGGGPISFGSLVRNGPVSKVELTLKNTSNVPVLVNSVTASSPWHVALALGTTIPPLGNDTFIIELKTDTAGNFNGSLSVSSNASISPYTIQLSGEVYQPDSQDIIYVDFDWTGYEDGSIGTPFNDLLTGTLYVNPSGTVRISAGSSAESIRITSPMTLEATGGVVTIGRQSNSRSSYVDALKRSHDQGANRNATDINWALYE